VLLERFLPFLKATPAPSTVDADTLEAELSRALETARAANPGIAIDDDVFLRYLAEHVPVDELPLDGALRDMRVDHLYLACACASGDERAIAALERAHFGHVRAGLAQMRLSEEQMSEVNQRVRERLLVAAGGKTPRIADYSGRGDLGRWLRAVAVRLAIDSIRSRGREVAPGDDALADMAVPGDDPELAHLKDRYSSEFRAAVKAAIGALDAETRGDLRLYYLDGLRLEELASLHRVAISTVSRRLAKARESVLADTRRRLREKLALSEQDVESVLGLIASRLELSHSAWSEPKKK